MADFITRLTERAVGMGAAVQPLIASVFNPEPGDHFPDLGWDNEARTSDELDRVQAPPVQQIPPAWDALKVVPKDTAMARREEQGTGTHIMPPPTSGSSDVYPEPHHPAGSATSERGITSGREDRGIASSVKPSYPRRKPDGAEADLPETRIMSEREDQRDLSPAPPEPSPRIPEPWPVPHHLDESGSLERRGVPRRDRQDPSRPPTRFPQTPPESQAETHNRAEPGLSQGGVLSTSQRAVLESLPSSPSSAKDGSSKALFSPIRSLVDQSQDADYGQDATLAPVPSSNIGVSPAAKGDVLGSRMALDRPAPLDASLVVAPRMVRPRLLDGDQERDRWEPRVPAPEPPAPTIRVAIGRIEVRAITSPPTPPAQRTAPARPGSALSLDDYLKRRNEGQR